MSDAFDHMDWEDDEVYLCCICEKNITTREYPICNKCDDTGNKYEEESN